MRRFKKKPFITVLDVGTSKICCLIAKISETGRPEVIGSGCVPAKGIQSGAVWDLEQATECIAAALHQAESQANYQVESVVVNISSSQLKSIHLYQEVDIPGGHQITAQDVKRLVDGMISKAPEYEEVVHAFPLGYIVDGERGTTDPRGSYGRRLGAHVHLITLPENQMLNLLTVLDRCHVGVDMKVATPYASALAVLTDDERDIGSTVIDLGAGTTSYAIFLGGGLVHLGVGLDGGQKITREIAEKFNTNIANAERLKVLNGAAFPSPRDELERLIVPILGEEADGANTQILRSDLIKAIMPQVQKMLEETRHALEQQDLFSEVTARYVLTGGGSGLSGIKEFASALLEGPVRIAKPHIIRNLPSQYDSFTFSTCVGLIFYVMMMQSKPDMEKFQTQSKQRGWIGRALQWLRQNL